MKKVKIITSSLLAASMLASCTPGQDSDTTNKSNAELDVRAGYEDKCGECREILPDDYKFCAHCGTKVGEGSFEPYENYNECVYGAPQHYTLKCAKCGFTMENSTMAGNVPEYCPYCGVEAEVKIKNLLDDDEESEGFAVDSEETETSEEE